VDLYWVYTNTNDRQEIDRLQPNNEYYIWNIPNDFTAYIPPTMIWEDTSMVSVFREPSVKIIPDLSTNLIDSSSFIIFSTGYFMTSGLGDTSMNIQLEMKDDNGQISYNPIGTEVKAIIKDNILNSISVLDPSSLLVFPGSLDPHNIDIILIDSNHPDNLQFGVVNNLFII